MALNLWKAGGQPTSFNPLPSGTFSVDIGIKDYVLTFNAISESNGQLRIVDTSTNGFDIDQRPQLSPTLKKYKYEFKSTVQQQLQFVDLGGTGDIIIQDIELVEKPLGVATINGIDGFLSDEWDIHPNATVIDDETLRLVADSIYNTSILKVSVVPGQRYTISIDSITGNVNMYEFNNGVSNGFFGALANNQKSKTVNLKSDSNVLFFEFSNNAIPQGQFTFKRPMLYKGDMQGVPYEPKKGTRMVEPKLWDDGTFHIEKQAKRVKKAIEVNEKVRSLVPYR